MLLGGVTSHEQPATEELSQIDLLRGLVVHCLVPSTGRVRRDATQKRMQRGLSQVVVQKLYVNSSLL